MAHEHDHGITGHAPEHTVPVPFTAAELHTFHTNDRKEATVVIALIASIFVIGLIIYITVAAGVAMNPNMY